jgi:hypothetical protein
MRKAKSAEWRIERGDDILMRIPVSVLRSGGLFDWTAKWMERWGKVLAFWFKGYVQELGCVEKHIFARLITFTADSGVQELVRSARSFCDTVQAEPLSQSWRIDCIECSMEESLFSLLFSNPDVVHPSGVYVVTDTIWEHKDCLGYLDAVERAVEKMQPVPLPESVRFLCYTIDNMVFIPSSCVESEALERSIAATAREFSLEPKWVS